MTPLDEYLALSKKLLEARAEAGDHLSDDEEDSYTNALDVIWERMTDAERAACKEPLEALIRESGRKWAALQGPHIVNGEWKSDKYAWCLPGFVPLKLTDKTAQPLLWQYAQVRRVVDADFSRDLELCLKYEGYEPPRSGEPVVCSLKDGTGTTIALSVSTASGWVRVELDWASLLAKRFVGSLSQRDEKKLAAEVRVVIEEAQAKIASLHDAFAMMARERMT
jgi:hypothetical protein